MREPCSEYTPHAVEGQDFNVTMNTFQPTPWRSELLVLLMPAFKLIAVHTGTVEHRMVSDWSSFHLIKAYQHSSVQ